MNHLQPLWIFSALALGALALGLAGCSPRVAVPASTPTATPMSTPTATTMSQPPSPSVAPSATSRPSEATPVPTLSASGGPIDRPPSRVPAAPNDSIVTARVLAVDQDPAQPRWYLTLEVQTSQDVSGVPANFTRARIGQTITATATQQPVGVQVSQVITAHVRFQGDERGGLFYISDIQTL